MTRAFSSSEMRLQAVRLSCSLPSGHGKINRLMFQRAVLHVYSLRKRLVRALKVTLLPDEQRLTFVIRSVSTVKGTFPRDV